MSLLRKPDPQPKTAAQTAPPRPGALNLAKRHKRIAKRFPMALAELAK